MKVYVVFDGEPRSYDSGNVVAVCASMQAVEAWALTLPIEKAFSEADDEWFLGIAHPSPGYAKTIGWYDVEEEADAAMRDPQAILSIFFIEVWDVRE